MAASATAKPSGAHQPRSAGVVQCDQTVSGGAGRLRVKRSVATLGPGGIGGRCGGLGVDRAAVLLEDRLLGLVLREAVEPVAQLAQAGALQRADATLPERVDRHEPGAAQRPQVLGDLRLAHAERCGDLTDGVRPRGEQLDDAQAARLGECDEGVGVHEEQYSS